MCGISVLLDASGSPDAATDLRRMHALIPHRGPDGEGFLFVSHDGAATTKSDGGFEAPGAAPLLGLAFRRLRILDLSESAAQPMASPERSHWIVFNGEIYNHAALRCELAARGHGFRTTGDTEVILAAYREWGVDGFDRLDGMWAIVIADLAKRRLVVSRDRFGIKPLYWSISGSRWLLASEARQIVAVREGSPSAAPDKVAAYLRGGVFPVREESFFAGVHEVPPATWCEIPFDARPETPQFRRYWSLASVARVRPRPYGEAREEFRQALEAAVASHRVADVRVGSLLSGGLDSSTLAVLLARAAGTPERPVACFSFGFREAAPEFCELKYVDAIADPRIARFETTFDAAWVGANVARVIRSLEQPPLGMPALAQFRVFELARQHGVTVLLDGEGADEILGGYGYHQRLLLADRLRSRRFGDFFREVRAIASRESRSMPSVLAGFFARPLLRRGRAARRPSPLAAKAARASIRPDGAGERGSDPSLVNRRLFFDVVHGNVRVVLPYTDRVSMAHSIEARVPYFDRRLIELSFSLPDDAKVGAGRRKRILRDVAGDLLPRQITERSDRMGFGMPGERMLRAIPEQIRDTVGEAAFAGSGWFDRAALDRFVRGFEAGAHRDAALLWRLFALAVWRREFGVSLG